jgi:hypothetical protein
VAHGNRDALGLAAAMAKSLHLIAVRS